MTFRAVTAREMREIDRRTTEEFGVPGYELMERAGRAVAEKAAESVGLPPKIILVLAGKGNNGGDGLVAARYLHQKGYSVQVFLFSEGKKLKADPARNFVANAKLNIPTRVVGEHFAWETVPELFRDSDLIIDALFGVGLERDLEEPYRGLIENVNRSGRRVVSVDIPSGLDSDTGKIHGAAIHATVTVAMGLAKKGFYEGEGPRLTGEVVVADIGFPKELLIASPSRPLGAGCPSGQPPLDRPASPLQGSSQ